MINKSWLHCGAWACTIVFDLFDLFGFFFFFDLYFFFSFLSILLFSSLKLCVWLGDLQGASLSLPSPAPPQHATSQHPPLPPPTSVASLVPIPSHHRTPAITKHSAAW